LNVVKLVVFVAIGIYILIALLLFFFQERFIFLPEFLHKDHTYVFDKEFEERWFDMADGARINALYFKANNPKGVIYYHHGNAGNLARWGEVSYFFTDLGYDVLIYDYRGYGKSTGERSEQVLFEDAISIYDQLSKEWPSERIVIYGRSIGSAMASYTASKKKHKFLILETPFHSLTDMGRHYFPVFPLSSFMNYPFENAEHLKKSKNPIFIFHGTEDNIVPYSSGLKLYKSLQDQPVEFITIEEGNHNNLIEFSSFRKRIKGVLQQSE